jgi:RHS repeat-associated protein
LPQVIRETDGLNNVIADYVYSDDTLLTQSRNGIASVFLPDGQMSVRALADETGNVTDRYDYDAFGNLIAKTGTTRNTWFFGAQQLDSTPGLYYLRARYYEPRFGRFTARDPFAGRILDPVTLHPYIYAGNDPMNRSDPTGTEFTLMHVVVAVAIAGGLAAAAYTYAETRSIPAALLVGGLVGTGIYYSGGYLVALAPAIGPRAGPAVQQLAYVVDDVTESMGPRLQQAGQAGAQQAVRFSDAIRPQLPAYRQLLDALGRFWRGSPSHQTILNHLSRGGATPEQLAGRLCGIKAAVALMTAGSYYGLVPLGILAPSFGADLMYAIQTGTIDAGFRCPQ